MNLVFWFPLIVTLILLTFLLALILEETYRQIKKYIFKNIPENYVGILNPNNYYDYKNRIWKNKDGAFFNTIGTKFIDFQSHMISNLYNLGTQNG